MRTRGLVLGLLAGTLISGQSLALDASGTTVGVKPDAKAAGAGGRRIIKIKGPITLLTMCGSAATMSATLRRGAGSRIPKVS